MSIVPSPSEDHDSAVAWVGAHLEGLWAGRLEGSGRFRGGSTAAQRALDDYDVRGYAAARNEVWPLDRRGASGLSPWIRHGLLTLPTVWAAVDGGPARDVGKFHDELLWQEYARHLYARLGRAISRPLRARLDQAGEVEDPWARDMACMDLTVGELHRDGWLVNQTRMWLASQWSVRHGRAWEEGEEHFFAHLLDGSRAANRLGWQWTVGTGTGRPYSFSRWQVEKRAPRLCASCRRRDDCPIRGRPSASAVQRIDPDPLLRRDPDPEVTAGPRQPMVVGPADAVWLTAESLGDDDPALSARPDLPAVFVFDAPLLRRLQLSAKRLVFLAECLADLATRRDVEVHVGDPAAELAGRSLATTFAPVPGWRRLEDRLALVEVHPWPWLIRPGAGSLTSFSAWRPRPR